MTTAPRFCFAFLCLTKFSKRGTCSSGKINERKKHERITTDDPAAPCANARIAVSRDVQPAGAALLHGAGRWFLAAESSTQRSHQRESLRRAGCGHRGRSIPLRGSLRQVPWRGRAGARQASQLAQRTRPGTGHARRPFLAVEKWQPAPRHAHMERDAGTFALANYRLPEKPGPRCGSSVRREFLTGEIEMI